MFEDNPAPISGGAPANLPAEPDDMFAKIDAPEPAVAGGIPDALSAGKLKPKMPASSAGGPVSPLLPLPEDEFAPVSQQPVSYATKGPVMGKVLLFIFLAILLGGLGFVGYLAYGRYFNKSAAVPTIPASENILPTSPLPSSPIEEEPSAAVINEPAAMPAQDVLSTSTNDLSTKEKNNNILFGEQPDSDQDGLSDLTENQIGTNPKTPDTDKDGLTDGDETLVWLTNPLNPDSDGDGYFDGVEVKNGYNPLGPGKLANLVQPATTTVKSAASSTSIKK